MNSSIKSILHSLFFWRKKSQNHETLMALKGRLCIYKEREMIFLLKVVNVTIHKMPVNNWVVSFSFMSVPAPGFTQNELPFSASCSMKIIRISERAIWAPYVNWILVIRPDLVDQIKAFACETNETTLLMNYINKLAFSGEQE